MILKYKALSNRIKIWSFPYLPPGSVRALVLQYVYIMSILWLDLTQVGRKKDLFSFDMTLNLLFKVQWLFCPKYFNATLLIKWCFFFFNVWLFTTMFRSDTCIFPNRNFLKANWFTIHASRRFGYEHTVFELFGVNN